CEVTQGGQSMIDEVDIQQATLGSARAQFALVTQEALLFSTSVLENIRIARPDASNEEVIAAAKVAQADEFIAPLPRGYLTGVGERGVVLTGGREHAPRPGRGVVGTA